MCARCCGASWSALSSGNLPCDLNKQRSKYPAGSLLVLDGKRRPLSFSKRRSSSSQALRNKTCIKRDRLTLTEAQSTLRSTDSYEATQSFAPKGTPEIRPEEAGELVWTSVRCRKRISSQSVIFPAAPLPHRPARGGLLLLLSRKVRSRLRAEP